MPAIVVKPCAGGEIVGAEWLLIRSVHIMRIGTIGLPIMRVKFDVRMPPSANSIWRSKRMPSGRLAVYRSVFYTKWLKEAGLEWMAQRPKGFQTIDSPFEATIILWPKTQHRMDPDNRTKAFLDFAKHAGMIMDDSSKYCRGITTRIGSSEDAPAGARLIIEPKLG